MDRRQLPATRTRDGVWRVTDAGPVSPRQRTAPRGLVGDARVMPRRAPQGLDAIPQRDYRRINIAFAVVVFGGFSAVCTAAVVALATGAWRPVAAVLLSLAAVGLLATRISHRGTCPGLHCKGCRG